MEPARPHAAPGAEAEYTAMVERNSALITRVCYMYATDRHHFDDLRQETLINLWRGFASFRGESSESTWIWRTCINTCISFHRRNRRHTGALPLDQVFALPDSDADPALQDRIAELYHYISTLNPVDKALVMLWLDDRPYDEISQITGMKRNTVASRLHRARLELTRKMNPGACQTPHPSASSPSPTLNAF